MGRTALVLALLLPAVASARPVGAPVLERREVAATGVTRAESRVIYLNGNGVILRPGDNDSTHDRSSIVERQTEIAGWDVDADTWQETVDCMREIYAPFDVTITDEDPGDTPHIEAVFGGSPRDVGLPENVAGVSPFTTDCAVIEHSIVFAFTDVMNDDPRTVCEVMAQEVAHSFGLDHEMLASDPMTYLTYLGERSFQDEMATCGEYDGRTCGINGSVCRARQNSYALLLERLGPNPDTVPDGEDHEEAGLRSGVTGCDVSGGGLGIGVVLSLAHVVARRRSRNRSHRPLLQRSSGDR